MSFETSLYLGLCLVIGFNIGTNVELKLERARYDFYRIYKVVSSNEKQLTFLKTLESSSDSVIFLDGITGVDRSLKIVIAPHQVPDFLQLLEINEIKYELLHSNLQALLDDGNERQVALPDVAAYDWTDYYELETNFEWLRSLTMKYNGTVTLIEAGKSHEGRPIMGVKISFNNSQDIQSQRFGIFLEAGIHAREWIAPATATYIINQLLTSNDTSIRAVRNFDWYIFPHVNPDGYAHTKINRLWRKTRKPQYGACIGVDPNRNWDIHWNELPTSDAPCSITYAGRSAFSEIEIKSFAEYIASLKGKIHLYIAFHSYSQVLIYPYAYTKEFPDNIEDYKQVANIGIAALKNRYGTKYTGGKIYDVMYATAGSSIDWVYEKAGIRMSFCYELRPNSSSLIGFKLPRNEIIPTGEETLDSIIAMVSEIKKLGYFN